METLRSVFVVDDDPIYQMITERKLKKLNCFGDITKMHDGDQAIRFINLNLKNDDYLPDIILLDINMPIMDGWDFIQEFQKIKNHISKPILIFMVSSSINSGEIERANQCEVIKEYIIKPLTDESFIRIAESAGSFT